MAINSARLKIPAPENYAILGTWGQGKTSLIYKFRQIVIEELQKEIKCACIYFPLSPESLVTLSASLKPTSIHQVRSRSPTGYLHIRMHHYFCGLLRTHAQGDT